MTIDRHCEPALAGEAILHWCMGLPRRYAPRNDMVATLPSVACNDDKRDCLLAYGSSQWHFSTVIASASL